ncbi:MAG: DEAD/DEAH box helicase [Gammaproteobacteria bacterium]|nr:MAG: DEAD/DEAH box helicase [Gammaproteobacteria bacterium]
MTQGRDEATTRRELIDRQLHQAGWSTLRRKVIEELALPRAALQTSDGSGDYGVEFADYALLGRDEKPLAIVEAKRTSRDPLVGERQATDYADLIQASYGVEPFIFLANGNEIWFLDRFRYPVRRVSGFFTRDDLERLQFQREYAIDPTTVAPNLKIIDRPYQLQAVKTICERLEDRHRKILLVMATGTGKTRTAIALVDVLLRSRWVQRVLFLADRRELVRQALGAFKEHLPAQSRTRVEGGAIDRGARIHVATYPSMMQVYQQLSPGFYDLIIADESHRSIYKRYKAILEHFDALQLGLTATPTDYIDHNTFDLFGCSDGLPTFNYSFEEAKDDKYLVNYKVLESKTKFQIQGIKAGQLPPELQRQIEEQGLDLSEIDFEGTDLERRVTNTGTNDAIVREFMENSRKDASGTLPEKSIIFAISHAHAMEIYKSFNRLYPALQAKGFARVIDSHIERADKILNDFKYEEMPRVAISVDMLDTGIDIPRIQNLVFAKPVYSQVKFWQMIGRGTRLWKDPHSGREKKDFLILDFWDNFAYFQMNPEGEVANPTEALPVRLFRLRLEKLLLLRGQGEEDHAADTVRQLQSLLAGVPGENVNVRPHAEEVQKLIAQAEAWDELDEKRLDYLSKTIAPLLRFLPDVNLPTMTFEARLEALAAAHLRGDLETVEQLRTKILDDLDRLPPELPEIAAEAETLAWARSDGFWRYLDYERILSLQESIAPLMRYRQRQPQRIIRLNLPDEIAARYWVTYGPAGEGAFVETYREQVETFVRELASQHPALQKLSRDEPLTDEELRDVENALNRPDLFITTDTLRQAYEQPQAELVDFLRHILRVATFPSREEVIRQAFQEFIQAHPEFRAPQIQFLRMVQTAIISRNRITTETLRLPPFSRIGQAEKLFNTEQLDDILALTRKFA